MTATASINPDTLPKQFLARVAAYGDGKIAVRQKDFGIWQEYTWQASYENTRDLCLGLLSLGLQRGDRVAIVGDNDRQYLWADFAILSTGAIVVGLFTDAIPSEMEYIISHSDAVLILAKDQEQCDKMLEIRGDIPNVKKVIYWETKGMWNYNDPWLLSFEKVQALGKTLHSEQPGRFEKEIAKGKGDDIANFCYTSGTTGLPKGAMLSHANLLGATDSYGSVEPRYDTDNLVSFTPLAWIAEQTLCIAPHVVFGQIVNFPEAPGTVQADIREIAPDILFYPARLWENVTAMIQMRINDSTWINRKLYDLFIPIGYKLADHRYEKKRVGPLLAALYWLGEVLLFRPLRNQLGLVHIRSAITAAASLSPDMLRFLRALGINLKQVFGTTETAAAGTHHRDGDIKFASVGSANPGIQVKVSGAGEIMVSGPNVFKGYFKNEEATASALVTDEEGITWFHSGDAGYMDPDGHLIYLDRMKDMIALASGEKYSPQFIEGRLKFSPYINEVMTVGGAEREQVTALVTIDYGNTGRWAEKQGLPYTTFVDLSQKREVYDLIRNDVEEVNQTLPAAARVRRFILMHKEFDADESEMTRTQKLRRRFLAERYSELISVLYSEQDSIHVKTIITYQDGRQGSIDTTLHIETLPEKTVSA